MKNSARTLCLILSLTSAAVAADTHQACQSDAVEFCSKAKSKADRVLCLEDHLDKLSTPCRQHLDEMRAAGEAFRADCKADIGGACLNLQGRALIECLEAQGTKLSKPCSDRIAAMRAARHAAHELISVACMSDAQKYCAKVAPGGISACLRSQSEVSKACRESLK